jgi:hypothetical protein
MNNKPTKKVSEIQTVLKRPIYMIISVNKWNILQRKMWLNLKMPISEAEEINPEVKFICYDKEWIRYIFDEGYSKSPNEISFIVKAERVTL